MKVLDGELDENFKPISHPKLTLSNLEQDKAIDTPRILYADHIKQL